MNPSRGKPSTPAPLSPGERTWRNTFYLMSALLAALALVQFDAGRWAHGLGDLGASVLMLSVMTQFPFVRAVIRVSRQEDRSPDGARHRQEELMRQAAELKAAHPWADVAGRAGWILLGLSLVLRLTGA